MIGLALLVAGLDKVTGGQAVVLASRWVTPSAIVMGWGLIECVIGWLTLTLVPHRMLRYILTLLFTIFVGVLAVEWYSGATQCPCLASSGLPIKFVVVFDLLALVSLVVFRSQWDHATFVADSSAGELLGHVKFVVPGVLVVAVIFFGSLDSALGYLSGRSLLVTPVERFIGEVEASQQVTTAFLLRNISGEPIRILGADASCGCVAIEDLPVTVPANESQSIRISLRGSAKPGVQRETATLICDDSASQLTLGVTALVHPNRNAVDANFFPSGEER
jgi:hypothetical protein